MARTIDLWSREGHTMVDWWTDDILVTKRKDGTFSLKARKYGDGRYWLRYGVTRRRTPDDFVDAVVDCLSTLGVDLDEVNLESLVPKLSELDPVFSDRVSTYLSRTKAGAE